MNKNQNNRHQMAMTQQVRGHTAHGRQSQHPLTPIKEEPYTFRKQVSGEKPGRKQVSGEKPGRK